MMPIPILEKFRIWQRKTKTGTSAGYQLHKKGCNRYYGIIADENFLMVSEYSVYGADAEIIVFKRWNGTAKKEWRDVQ